MYVSFTAMIRPDMSSMELTSQGFRIELIVFINDNVVAHFTFAECMFLKFEKYALSFQFCQCAGVPCC